MTVSASQALEFEEIEIPALAPPPRRLECERITVDGDLTLSDTISILGLIQRAREVERASRFRIQVTAPGVVEVWTGDDEEPYDGTGCVLHVIQDGTGCWQVSSRGYWIA